MKHIFYIFLVLLSFSGCKKDAGTSHEPETPKGQVVPVKYASGFTITDYGNYYVLTVEDPWPNADRSFTYILAEEGAEVPENILYDHRIEIPVQRIVATSTTHIPSLELLNEEKSLVGFPGLDYISSEETRKQIDQNLVKELGKNETLNTESVLSLKPDVLVAFSINGSNKSLRTIEKSGIPVLFNSDWTENSPLGKAEWVKFFGALYGKLDMAQSFFEQVEKNYREAKEKAKKAERKPTVVAGAMYKDQWYLPAGDSWQSHFFEDANAQYLFKDTEGTGSLSLSFEAVLAKAGQADFWIGPAQFQSYEELERASPHYTQFKAFQNRNVYTYSSEKGETGGVLFYELAPNRPDLVLKDLISILHPEIFSGYQTTFYKPLE